MRIPIFRIVVACLLSLGGYLLLCTTVLDRPLTHGKLAAAMQAQLDRAAILESPKLVILAGSNGPYSHRCETIERALAIPCVNAGIAVGIGLDYLFARWDAHLHAGDVVYLPMEPAQYTRSRLATATGPDAAIMARHDRATLAALTPDRWLGAAFATDLRAMVMAATEMALAGVGFADTGGAGGTNAYGDRIGHSAERAALPSLRAMTQILPDAAAVRAGHGTALISAFVWRMQARGVRVIGGLSTGFADTPLSEEVIATIAAIYTGNGGMFLALPNHSRYAREYVFDGPEHLSEPYQVAHSRAVAHALARILGAPHAGL